MVTLKVTTCKNRLLVHPTSSQYPPENKTVLTRTKLKGVMTATIEEERYIAQRDSQEGMWAIFRGRNLLRFLIASWPKITQQLVGLSVFNTYATYFCKL